MSLSNGVILPGDWTNVANTGKSMNELGDAWAIRAYGIPTPDNSFAFADDTDPRGKLGSIEKANIDQPDPIFFLGGRFVSNESLPIPGDPFTFTRSVVVPDGAVLVTPLINITGPDGFVNPPQIRPTEEEIRNTGYVDSEGVTHSGVATILNPFLFKTTVAVDGEDVTTIPYVTSERNTDFRRESPDGGFRYRLPNDNVQDGLRVDENGDPIDIQAQVVPLAISDGYWYAYDTSGLGEGSHTFNFEAGVYLDITDPPDGIPDPLFVLNVTYNLLNSIEGNNGNNNLSGSAVYDDYINGRNGDDILSGQGGGDVMVGGNGKDILDGGFGNDELWGNNGKDTFVYAEDYGTDTIFDFQDRLDKIDVSAFGFGNGGPDFSGVDISNDSIIFAARGITEVAKIDFRDITGNTDDIILLPNVDASLISAADFIF
jgi:hypothetical protein